VARPPGRKGSQAPWQESGSAAAGAILAMIADTMIPVAFHEDHEFAGLITAVGFLLAFVVSKIGGLT